MTKRQLIQKLIDCGVIQKGKFVLRSGKKADFYIDLKKAYGEPEILTALVDEMIRLVPKRTTCIATIGQGGVPLATLVSYKLNLRLVLVRDKPRRHGTQKKIDGHIPSQVDRVVIIDDVFTTGSSIKDIAKNLKPTNCKIISAVVAVKRGESKNLKKVKITSIFSQEDFYKG